MVSPVCKKINKRMAFILKEYEAGTGITDEMKAFQLHFITLYFELKSLSVLRQTFPNNAAAYDRREETVMHLQECVLVAMKLLNELGNRNPYESGSKKTQEAADGGVTANWGDADGIVSGRSSPFSTTSSVVYCSSRETESTERTGSQDSSELDEYESDDGSVRSIVTVDLSSDEDTQMNTSVNRDGFSQTEICVNHYGSQTDIAVLHEFAQTETCVNQDEFCQTDVKSQDETTQADLPPYPPVLKDVKTIGTETEAVPPMCKYCSSIVSADASDDNLQVSEGIQLLNASKTPVNKNAQLKAFVDAIMCLEGIDFSDALTLFMTNWDNRKLKNKTPTKPQLEKQASTSLKVPSKTAEAEGKSVSPLASPGLRNSESHSIDSDASAGEKCVPTSSNTTLPANPQKRKHPESTEALKTAAKRNKNETIKSSDADQLPTSSTGMTLANLELTVLDAVMNMMRQCVQEVTRYVTEMDQLYPQNKLLKSFLQVGTPQQDGSTTLQNNFMLQAILHGLRRDVTSTPHATVTCTPTNVAPLTISTDQTRMMDGTAAAVSQRSATSKRRNLSGTRRRSSVNTTAQYATATAQNNQTVAQQDTHIATAVPQINATSTQNDMVSNIGASILRSIINNQHNMTSTPQSTAGATPQYDATAMAQNNRTALMQSTQPPVPQSSMTTMPQNHLSPNIGASMRQNVVNNQQNIISTPQNTSIAAPQYNGTMVQNNQMRNSAEIVVPRSSMAVIQQNNVLPNFGAMMSQNVANAMHQQNITYMPLNTAPAMPQNSMTTMQQSIATAMPQYNPTAMMQNTVVPPNSMTAIQQSIATTTAPNTSNMSAQHLAYQSIGLGQTPQFDLLFNQIHNAPRPPSVSVYSTSSVSHSIYPSHYDILQPPRLPNPPMNQPPPALFNGQQLRVRLPAPLPHLLRALNENPSFNQRL